MCLILISWNSLGSVLCLYHPVQFCTCLNCTSTTCQKCDDDLLASRLITGENEGMLSILYAVILPFDITIIMGRYSNSPHWTSLRAVWSGSLWLQCIFLSVLLLQHECFYTTWTMWFLAASCMKMSYLFIFFYFVVEIPPRTLPEVLVFFHSSGSHGATPVLLVNDNYASLWECTKISEDWSLFERTAFIRYSF